MTREPGGSLPRSVARGRLFNARKRSGGVPPGAEFQSSPEVVIWRAKPCNCRVLSVFLDPQGWHGAGDRFRVSMEEQLERMRRQGVTELPLPDGKTVDVTLDNYRAGQFATFGPRRVNGAQFTQPLDFGQWELSISFEAGCDHGNGYRDMADVLDDCRSFRTGRQRVERPIFW